MSSNKNVIVTFQKDSSKADRQKLLKDLESNGGKIIKDENIDSVIMPFATVSLPSDHFDSLRSDSLQGHKVIKGVEEDQEMRIQDQI